MMPLASRMQTVRSPAPEGSLLCRLFVVGPPMGGSERERESEADSTMVRWISRMRIPHRDECTSQHSARHSGLPGDMRRGKSKSLY